MPAQIELITGFKHKAALELKYNIFTSIKRCRYPLVFVVIIMIDLLDALGTFGTVHFTATAFSPKTRPISSV
jgi:hypothetical protein